MSHDWRWNVDGTMTWTCATCGRKESADRIRWKAPGGEWQKTLTPPCEQERT